jgi:hypothetical protein
VRELQFPGGQHASVPGDDTAFRIDEHGVIETELGDAGGDLPDLDSGMGARIAHVRQKLIDLPEFDVKSGRWSGHGSTLFNELGCRFFLRILLNRLMVPVSPFDIVFPRWIPAKTAWLTLLSLSTRYLCRTLMWQVIVFENKERSWSDLAQNLRRQISWPRNSSGFNCRSDSERA